jgi:hypothetical protein
MKKIVCGFVFGLMLMVSGAQAWADGTPVPPNPNPKLASIAAIPVLADGTPLPPNPNPRLQSGF